MLSPAGGRDVMERSQYGGSMIRGQAGRKCRRLERAREARGGEKGGSSSADDTVAWV